MDRFNTIREDVRVGKNKNLKWCPRPDCGKAVPKPGIFSNKATCECGTVMCFKCGGEWHPGRCQYEGTTAFYIWQSTNPNVAKCPHCRVVTHKEGGCNHMTCGRCANHWCWVCRARLDSKNYWNHWDSLFGCLGMKDSMGSYLVVLLMQIGILGFLPIIVYFVVLLKLMKKGLYKLYIDCATIA